MGRGTQFFLVYGITWFIVPAPAGRWCLVELFWADDGQTIPPHHSIAKYLKNLKLIPRTTTFFLRHCVNIPAFIVSDRFSDAFSFSPLTFTHNTEIRMILSTFAANWIVGRLFLPFFFGTLYVENL